MKKIYLFQFQFLFIKYFDVYFFLIKTSLFFLLAKHQPHELRHGGGGGLLLKKPNNALTRIIG